MATFNPRKFSEPDRLKTIAPERLVRFLAPFADYLTGRGFALPARPSEGMDFETLAGILMRPDEKVPREMVDALFYVHEMATDEAMDALLDAASERGLMLELRDRFLSLAVVVPRSTGAGVRRLEWSERHEQPRTLVTDAISNDNAC